MHLNLIHSNTLSYIHWIFDLKYIFIFTYQILPGNISVMDNEIHLNITLTNIINETCLRYNKFFSVSNTCFNAWALKFLFGCST